MEAVFRGIFLLLVAFVGAVIEGTVRAPFVLEQFMENRQYLDRVHVRDVLVRFAAHIHDDVVSNGSSGGGLRGLHGVQLFLADAQGVGFVAFPAHVSRGRKVF